MQSGGTFYQLMSTRPADPILDYKRTEIQVRMLLKFKTYSYREIRLCMYDTCDEGLLWVRRGKQMLPFGLRRYVSGKPNKWCGNPLYAMNVVRPFGPSEIELMKKKFGENFMQVHYAHDDDTDGEIIPQKDAEMKNLHKMVDEYASSMDEVLKAPSATGAFKHR